MNKSMSNNPFFNAMSESFKNFSSSKSYPFWDFIYDNEKQKAMLNIALAGYSREGIDVTMEGDSLIVKVNNENVESEIHYSHKGISTKSFRLKYNLIPGCVVKEAEFEDGLLKIEFADEKFDPVSIPILGKPA